MCRRDEFIPVVRDEAGVVLRTRNPVATARLPESSRTLLGIDLHFIGRQIFGMRSDEETAIPFRDLEYNARGGVGKGSVGYEHADPFIVVETGRMDRSIFDFERPASPLFPSVQRLTIVDRLPFVPSAIFDTDVSPAHTRRLLPFEGVNLQGDETGEVRRIDQIDTGNAVDPRANAVALSFDAVLVPLVVFECGLTGRIDGGIGGRVLQPSATRFIINTPRVPRRRIRDLHLITMHAAGGLLARQNLFAIECANGRFDGITMAADLDTGVQRGVGLGFEFKGEIAVLAIGTEKAVRASLNCDAYNFAVLNRIPGGSVALLPAVERLPVEDRDERGQAY
jgi:hypothetical protein